MAHTYGNMDTLRRWLTGGEAARDPELLTVLESSSRAVDAFCSRGSGFGPVHETRTYTATRSRLLLGGDLAAYTTLTVDDVSVTPPDIEGGYTRCLEGYTGTVVVEGDWTYPCSTVAVGALEASLDDATEVIEFTTTPAVSEGMTILVDNEQMYVLAVDLDTSITVARGAHGTTAAAHLDEAPIRAYRYEGAATEATYRLAVRRWRDRDAGLTGMFGGGDVPVTSNQDTEWSILVRTLSHLRFLSVY